MMAEHFKIIQSPWLRTSGSFERTSHPLVEFDPARYKDILVHDLMHKRVFEAVPCTLPAIAELLDQIDFDKAIECGFPALWSRCYALQKPAVELCTQYGCLLEEAP